MTVVRIMGKLLFSVAVEKGRFAALERTLVAISEQINRIIRALLFQKTIKSWTV
jgi:hypothetical protein